jgi:putative phage-type endonuclease
VTAPAIRSPEWLETRRAGITSTDLPVILGLSPYTSEASLARQKRGLEEDTIGPDRERVMRIGLAIEDVTRREYETETGRRLRRVRRLIAHPDIPWALTSLDFETVGEKPARIVEAKASRSARWAEELPQDVEAQVRWEMGVARREVADVAALLHGSELRIYTVEHDRATFDGLVAIAEDFRRRLDAGGPFAENAASVKARYPFDSGAEMVADAELETLVAALIETRTKRQAVSEQEEAIETRIKQRMADFAALAGEGWRITWKRTKDVASTDWKSIADGLLRQLPEDQRDALVSVQTTVRAGFRPFRVVIGKEN